MKENLIRGFVVPFNMKQNALRGSVGPMDLMVS